MSEITSAFIQSQSSMARCCLVAGLRHVASPPDPVPSPAEVVAGGLSWLQ